MQTGAATVQNSMEVPQKVNHTTGYLPKEYMHPYVYSCIIYNRQGMEEGQVPIN